MCDSTQVLSHISQLCSPYSTHKVIPYVTSIVTMYLQGSVAHIGLPLEWQLAYVKPVINGNAVGQYKKLN